MCASATCGVCSSRGSAFSAHSPRTKTLFLNSASHVGSYTQTAPLASHSTSALPATTTCKLTPPRGSANVCRPSLCLTQGACNALSGSSTTPARGPALIHCSTTRCHPQIHQPTPTQALSQPTPPLQ